MSRLSDYSKFDHLDDSDDDNDDNHEPTEPLVPNAAEPPDTTSAVMARDQDRSATYHRRDSSAGRFVFVNNGQTMYEWEQTVDVINLYVPAPPHVSSARELTCRMQPTHLALGTRHAIEHENAYYLNFALSDAIDTDESTWYLEDDTTGRTSTSRTICLVLTKAHPGKIWTRVFSQEPSMDAALQQGVQEELMKERFQMEHPGFDFRDAKFSGSAPDPRSFLGGMPSM